MFGERVECIVLLIGLAGLLLQGPEVAASPAGIVGRRQSHHFLFSTWSEFEPVPKGPPGQEDVVNGHLQALSIASWGFLIYVACLLGTVLMVVVIYASRSALQICSIVVYLLALCTVRLCVKAVYVGCHFNFPLALSAIHFAFGAIAAFGVLFYRQRYRGEAVPVPSRGKFVRAILPIAMCFAVCIGVGNQVLELCSIAFTEIVMSAQPLMAVPMVLLLGLPFDALLLLPMLLVVAGCVTMSLGEVHFSGLGLALAGLSIVLRAAKAALQQKLLSGDQSDRLDPCALLAWMCLPSAALMVAWSALAEGMAPLQQVASHPEKRWSLVFVVIMSSVNATILNLSQLFVVEDLGAVGSQLVGQLKTGLTIMGGVVLLSEKVGAYQGAGAVTVIAGTFIFARLDQHAKAASRNKRLSGQLGAKAPQ
mmetsp:Transcript_109799/g.321507  ORF Transcript_109799/g.321507 Transcript_109799/m.321507 type:complete len:422 (+) Transcript_109799:75-1340(+)